MKRMIFVYLALFYVGIITGVNGKQCFVPGHCTNSLSVAIVNSPNEIDCLQLCQKDASCNWFSYFPTLQVCDLLANCTINVEACTDCLSGEKTCEYSDPVCSVTGECKGNIISGEQASSEMECLKLCKLETRCNWFTYNLPGHGCFLFSNCETFDESTKSCVSGEKSCTYTSHSTGYSKVLVATGYSDAAIADVEIIDILSSNTICQNLPDFPLATFEAVGGLTFQDHPIICGGINGDKAACYLYEDGVWKVSNPLLQGRYRSEMRATPFQDSTSKLFVAGGYASAALSSTEILTIYGWQQSVPLPVTIYWHCMVTVNSTTVMAISGLQNGGTKVDTYLFNTESNAWSQGPPLQTKREKHSCATIRSNSQTQRKSIVAVGGVGLKSVEVLDLLFMDAWSRGPELPIEIYNAALVEDPNGGVVLIGGYNGKRLDTLYRLPHAGSDAVWEVMSQRLKTERSEFAAFLVPDDITVCSQR